MFGWLKRKPRNRRFDREYLLESRLRVSRLRAGRMKLAGAGVAALLVLVLLVLGSWSGGYWLLNKFVYENDDFAIDRIEVQTDGVLSPDIIRRWAMVKPGQNLLALDLTLVKRDLEMQSAVASACVERLLPRTLRLRVKERNPIAQTVVSQKEGPGPISRVIYQFDGDGFALRPFDPRWLATPAPTGSDALPILVGVPANQVQPGQPLSIPQARAALALVDEFDHSPMTGLVELEKIDVSIPQVLQVVTSQGAVITFSLIQFDQQFRRWRQVYDYGQKQGKAIATLDLSIANNLPVCWVPAANVQPLTKHAKPARTKPNHA